MPNDSVELRRSLADIFPHLIITDVAKTSGQRVVYFGYFDESLVPDDYPQFKAWCAWGPVVMKVVAGVDASSLTYFQREIAILQEIDSPYYPRLLYSETYHENPVSDERLPDRLFITIEERIDSLPLSSCGSRFDNENSVVCLLLSLCEGLKLLWNHKNKIVHRDLKPDNILIRADGTVAIIDLGITRETGTSGVTQTFFAHGPMTLRYASPEQATNDKRNITFKSDFFSLGIIAYELIAGKNPFVSSADSSAIDIFQNLISFNPQALHEFNSVSSRFSAFIVRLLEKQPYKRFRTVDVLMAELTAIQRKENGN